MNQKRTSLAKRNVASVIVAGLMFSAPTLVTVMAVHPETALAETPIQKNGSAITTVDTKSVDSKQLNSNNKETKPVTVNKAVTKQNTNNATNKSTAEYMKHNLTVMKSADNVSDEKLQDKEQTEYEHISMTNDLEQKTLSEKLKPHIVSITNQEG